MNELGDKGPSGAMYSSVPAKVIKRPRAFSLAKPKSPVADGSEGDHMLLTKNFEKRTKLDAPVLGDEQIL